MRKPLLLLFNILLLLTVFFTSCNKEKEETENQFGKNKNLPLSSQSSNLSIDLKEIYKLAWQAMDKEPDKALLYSNELLKASQDQNDKKGELLAYYVIGYVYETKHLYAMSLTNYLNSLRIAQDIKDKGKIANCYQGIGNVHFQVSLYEEAITFYNKGLENLEDQKMVAKVYRDIGVAYRENKDYDQAKNYFIKSLNVRKTLSDQYDLANSYNDVGDLLKEMNEYDEALGYLHQSLIISQSLPNHRLMSFAIYNIGYIYYKQGNYVQAKDYYTKALDYGKEINDFPEFLISLHRDIGLNELAMNQSNEAISHLEKAEAIAQGNNHSKLLIEITGLLSESYKKIGDNQKALYYSDKSRNIQTDHTQEQIKAIEENFRQQSEVKQIDRGSFINKKNNSGSQILWIVCIFTGLISGAGVTLLGIKRKVKIVETPMIKLRDPNLVDLSWWHKNQLKWIEEEAIESKKLIQGIEAVIKESLDKPTKEVVQVILAQLKERLKTIRYWSTATNDVDPTPPPKPPKD